MLGLQRDLRAKKIFTDWHRTTLKRLSRTNLFNAHCFVVPMPRICQKTLFHTTSRKQAAPLVALLLKTGGVKVMKVLSVLFGRSFRKLYGKLPESVQSKVGKHKLFFSVVGFSTPFIGYYSYTHYESCPITGRKRLITLTRDQVVALSDLNFEKLMQEHKDKLLSESHPLYQKNKAVVSHLVSGNCDIEFVKNTEWSLHVIDDPTVTNAFVLPNGHIFVFTGMLKMLNTWEEMAVILGHEMSHAILGHSQEQQSYLAFWELLTIPLLAFIWFMLEDFAFLIYMIQHHIYPIIFKYGFSLPYSRSLETEADEVGLMLSSKACYDPRWSVLLWEKMALKEALEGDGDTEEFDFLSTHPSNQKRSLLLERKLPEVLELRKKCNCPPLPTDLCPQEAAHQMRKCIQIVKERKTLMEQLKEKATLLESENFIETKEKTDVEEKKLQKLKAESEELKEKLQRLEADYVLLVSAPQFERQCPQTKSPEKIKEPKAGASIFADVWCKITGKVATTGKLTDTLFEKESKLTTVSVEESAFGTTKSS